MLIPTISESYRSICQNNRNMISFLPHCSALVFSEEREGEVKREVDRAREGAVGGDWMEKRGSGREED